MKRYRKPAQTKDLKEHDRAILAHGEMTGHHHEVVDAATTLDLAEVDIPACDFFEEPDGRRVLLAHRDNWLQHQEHGRIRVVPSEARRGAQGERDVNGRLIGQYRQGDVLMEPIGDGVWEVIRQNEHQPEAIRNVAD